MNRELSGKKVLVFGSGKSGIGAAQLLKKVGAEPLIYDGNRELKKEDILERLGFLAPVILGEMGEDEVGSCDLVVISPGVPCDLPLVQAFYRRGIPVWGEIELAYRMGQGEVLAVTGTNGKTTTVSLLGKIAEDFCEESYVVGNIGRPYADVVLEQTSRALTIAEVSSFQLETIDLFHPRVSAITNITEDHLNRHHTMEEYIRVKERITENQTEDEICVLNYEDETLRSFGKSLRQRVVWFSSRRQLDEGIFLAGKKILLAEAGQVTEVVDVDDLQILGSHNYENVMVAVAMALSSGIPMDSIRRSVCAFRGVEHRIEFVEEIDGVRYYNDSKGTNPDAAIKGIQAMNRPTLLIAGGYDKESGYDDWIRSFDGKVVHLALIGQTREKIRESAIRCGLDQKRISLYDSLEAAVQGCAGLASEGDAVLLSPACASWGQFENYEKRGDLFKDYVRALAGGEKEYGK